LFKKKRNKLVGKKKHTDGTFCYGGVVFNEKKDKIEIKGDVVCEKTNSKVKRREKSQISVKSNASHGTFCYGGCCFE